MQQQGGQKTSRIPKPPMQVGPEDGVYEDPQASQQPYGYPPQYYPPPPPPTYYPPAPPPPPTRSGGLGYAGGGGSEGKKSGGMSMAQALMVIIVAALISLVAGWQLFAMKGDVTAVDPAVVQGNYDRSVGNATTLTNQGTQVNNLINSQGDYLKKGDAGSYIDTAMTGKGYVTESKVQELIDKALEEYTPTTTTPSTTPPSSSSTVPTTAGGNVTVGVYTAPNSGAPIYSAGDYTWFLQFSNYDTAYHKVFLLGTLSPNSSFTNNGVIDAALTTCIWQITASPDTTFTVTPVPGGASVTTNMTMASKGYTILAPGEVKLIPVTLHLVYTSGTTWWDSSWTVSVQNYP